MPAIPDDLVSDLSKKGLTICHLNICHLSNKLDEIKLLLTSVASHRHGKPKSHIGHQQKPIRVETCNGPLCAGKQASEYSNVLSTIFATTRARVFQIWYLALKRSINQFALNIRKL